MPMKTLDPLVRAAMVITAVVAAQNVRVEAAHVCLHTARTTSRVLGNRLLQVNQPGSVVLDGDGRIVSGLLGGLILRYKYDAFGRLIQKHLPLSDTDYQSEDHYYDDVRRIQTIGYRYEDPNGPSIGTGGVAFGEDEGNLLGFLLDPILLPPVETFWTEREYVYGTG